MSKASRQVVNYRLNIVYEFLTEYITEHGYAPTIREIASGIGIDSTATIYRYLELLGKMNKIRRNKRMPRSIKIVEMEEAEQMHSDKLKSKTCAECIENMKETGAFTAEQIEMFEKIFYSASDKCLFK